MFFFENEARSRRKNHLLKRFVLFLTIWKVSSMEVELLNECIICKENTRSSLCCPSDKVMTKCTPIAHGPFHCNCLLDINQFQAGGFNAPCPICRGNMKKNDFQSSYETKRKILNLILFFPVDKVLDAISALLFWFLAVAVHIFSIGPPIGEYGEAESAFLDSRMHSDSWSTVFSCINHVTYLTESTGDLLHSMFKVIFLLLLFKYFINFCQICRHVPLNSEAMNRRDDWRKPKTILKKIFLLMFALGSKILSIYFLYILIRLLIASQSVKC